MHGFHDTSVHLCVPAGRGQQLTELRWAEQHRFEEFGTEYMVHGLRPPEEVAVVL